MSKSVKVPRGLLTSLVPVFLVPDVAEAAKFYVMNLGFTEDTRPEADGCRLVFRDGIEIRLVEVGALDSTSPRAPRVADVVVFADDVQVLYEELVDRGAPAAKPSEDSDGSRSLWVEDCNGYLIRFVQPTQRAEGAVEERHQKSSPGTD